jgi:hypothetical protein
MRQPAFPPEGFRLGGVLRITPAQNHRRIAHSRLLGGKYNLATRSCAGVRSSPGKKPGLPGGAAWQLERRSASGREEPGQRQKEPRQADRRRRCSKFLRARRPGFAPKPTRRKKERYHQNEVKDRSTFQPVFTILPPIGQRVALPRLSQGVIIYSVIHGSHVGSASSSPLYIGFCDVSHPALLLYWSGVIAPCARPQPGCADSTCYCHANAHIVYCYPFQYAFYYTNPGARYTQSHGHPDRHADGHLYTHANGHPNADAHDVWYAYVNTHRHSQSQRHTRSFGDCLTYHHIFTNIYLHQTGIYAYHHRDSPPSIRFNTHRHFTR